MGKVVKVAISLPEDLLKRVDLECQNTKANRSQFIRQTIECFLKEQKKQEAIAHYLRGYLEQPETQIEAEGMLQIALQTIKQEDWT